MTPWSERCAATCASGWCRTHRLPNQPRSNMTDIPQDFIEIDADENHWVMTGVSGSNEGRRFPDPNLFCVPSTDANSDMTDAMMSEIPGWDDTVEPLKLEDKRGYKFAMAFLMQDGNLAVPGGRYGSDTATCAPIAILMA